MKKLSDRLGEVGCTSARVTTVHEDGTQTHGWMYGFHFLPDDPPPECPRCGCALNPPRQERQFTVIDWKDATKEQPDHYNRVLGYTSFGLCGEFWFRGSGWEGDLHPDERVTHWAHLNPPQREGGEKP